MSKSDNPDEPESSFDQKVSLHYDTRINSLNQDRSTSRIITLRSFNNWVKTTLMFHVRQLIPSRFPVRAIDLACGRGGDVSKWRRIEAAHVVFVDFSKQSLDECQSRYSSMRSANPGIFNADFHELNMISGNLYHTIFKTDDPVPSNSLFRIISCQFAVHYAFSSYEDLVSLLSNVSKCLRSGGYFIGTTTDCFEIVRRLRKRGNEFGNSVYEVKFREKDTQNKIGLFDVQFLFKLDDLLECPEYLVYFPVFRQIASQFGLKLIMRSNFCDFFKNYHRSNEKILRRMDALEAYPPNNDEQTLYGGDPNGPQYAHAKRFLETNCRNNNHTGFVGTMSKDEWEVASLYTCFIFKKV